MTQEIPETKFRREAMRAARAAQWPSTTGQGEAAPDVRAFWAALTKGGRASSTARLFLLIQAKKSPRAVIDAINAELASRPTIVAPVVPKGMATVVDNTTTKLDGALRSPLPHPSPAWDAGAEGLTASPGDDSTGSSALRTADDANAVVRQQRLAVLHEEIAAAEAALGDLWQQQKAAATGSAALAQLRRDWLTVVCQLQLDLATAGAADVALEQEVAAAQALFEALSEQQERAGATADAIYDAAQAAAEHLLQLREEAAAEAAAAEAAAEQHHHQQQQSVEMAASITTSFPPMDDGDTTAKLLVEEHHHDERRQAATLVDGANGDCTMGEAHEQAEHGQVAAGVDQGEAGEDGMTSLVPTTTTSAHNIVASGAASTAEAEAALVTVIAGYDANADTLDSSPVEAAGLVAATAIKCPGDGSNVVATSQSPVAESVEAADLRVPATDCITTNTTTASASQESRRASDAAPPASSAGAPSSAELAAALQAALDINRELNTAIEKLTDENSALVQQNEVLEKALRAAQAALREVATKGFQAPKNSALVEV